MYQCEGVSDESTEEWLNLQYSDLQCSYNI